MFCLITFDVFAFKKRFCCVVVPGEIPKQGQKNLPILGDQKRWQSYKAENQVIIQQCFDLSNSDLLNGLKTTKSCTA